VRTIELKKRSTSKADTEVEIVTIQIRRFYTVEQGAADILYARTFEDEAGEEYTLKSTIGAVALAEKLLSDFLDDGVTAQPY
jgi:exoribonuclease II